MGLSVFCGVHAECPDLRFVPLWDESLFVLLEISCYCPTCGEARTYAREGGDTPA